MNVPAVQVEGIEKTYDGRIVLGGISFHVEAGEWFGILGPNGSGKSTLLQIVTGVVPADGGQVLLHGKTPETYGRKEMARRVAVLPQDALPPLGFTVREVIEMGRYPYQNWFGDEKGDAGALVDRIIDRLRLGHLCERSVEALSGGERQRVALGKVMAQEPMLLLLDEPTTFLDIGYQLEMMEFVRTWQEECGLTVVSILHDLNLAAQYCDRLLLLHDAQAAAIGTAEEVIRAELLEQVYGTVPHVMKHPVSGVPQVLLGTVMKKGRVLI
ncbi:ABC transporter ATP-binding protein [Paenibacillus silviterrae]|uniref:ABC transporter ATP-binding protein n=1 Tax=Paenibacillus silviterrae TaxID=3242194 RepID=UPI002543447B|nr:ABC transporter ATP-binding protein [Paenibacillus chinjuensis]